MGNFNYATLCTHCTQLLELASWISKVVFKASRFIFGLSELFDFVCELEDIVFVSVLLYLLAFYSLFQGIACQPSVLLYLLAFYSLFQGIACLYTVVCFEQII